MEKPILATNIDGLLIEHEAFTEPHKAWFDRAIKKTGDTSLETWKGKEDYFKGVNMVMEKIMPEATPEQRTLQARNWYQEDVVTYIREHPEVVKKDIAEKLRRLKNKFKLILITTNTKDHINNILRTANLSNIYDVVIASQTEKEPNKEELVDQLLEQQGKPKYYLTGKEDEKITTKLRELEVKVIGINDISRLE